MRIVFVYSYILYSKILVEDQNLLSVLYITVNDLAYLLIQKVLILLIKEEEMRYASIKQI